MGIVTCFGLCGWGEDAGSCLSAPPPPATPLKWWQLSSLPLSPKDSWAFDRPLPSRPGVLVWPLPVLSMSWPMTGTHCGICLQGKQQKGKGGCSFPVPSHPVAEFQGTQLWVCDMLRVAVAWGCTVMLEQIDFPDSVLHFLVLLMLCFLGTQ